MVTERIRAHLEKAEGMRVAIAGDIGLDGSHKKNGYSAVIQVLEQSVSGFDEKNILGEDDRVKIAVGQALYSIADSCCSMAKHGALDNDEKEAILQRASDIVDGPLFQACLSAMLDRNTSATDEVIIWGAETQRLRARIEERRPTPDLEAARRYYSDADRMASRVFSSSIGDDPELEKNRLAACYVALTARAEYAGILPSDQRGRAKEIFKFVSRAIFDLYAVHGGDFDRVETTIGRALAFCHRNGISLLDPGDAVIADSYLDLAKMTKDKTRFRQRIQIAREQSIEPDFYDRLEQSINEQ